MSYALSEDEREQIREEWKRDKAGPRMCRYCDDVPAVEGERECASCIAHEEAVEARAVRDNRRSDDR